MKTILVFSAGLRVFMTVFGFHPLPTNSALATVRGYLDCFTKSGGCEKALEYFKHGLELIRTHALTCSEIGIRDVQRFHGLAVTALASAIARARREHPEMVSALEKDLQELRECKESPVHA